MCLYFKKVNASGVNFLLGSRQVDRKLRKSGGDGEVPKAPGAWAEPFTHLHTS